MAASRRSWLDAICSRYSSASRRAACRASGDRPARTGLLHEEIVEDGEGAELQRQLISYSDYQDVDGTMVPFNITVTTTVAGVGSLDRRTV